MRSFARQASLTVDAIKSTGAMSFWNVETVSSNADFTMRRDFECLPGELQGVCWGRHRGGERPTEIDGVATVQLRRRVDADLYRRVDQFVSAICTATAMKSLSVIVLQRLANEEGVCRELAGPIGVIDDRAVRPVIVVACEDR